jgi:hypothetical protein
MRFLNSLPKGRRAQSFVPTPLPGGLFCILARAQSIPLLSSLDLVNPRVL